MTFTNQQAVNSPQFGDVSKALGLSPLLPPTSNFSDMRDNLSNHSSMAQPLTPGTPMDREKLSKGIELIWTQMQMQKT